MKRLLICSAFVLISAVMSLGQCVGNCTSITAALTDGGGQQWPNATVTILLVRPFGNPAPVLNNGVPVNSPVNILTTNGSGVFTVSLDDTTKLTPSGAQWQFTMCPNASVSNCSQITTGVFGASQNLTSLLSGALITPVVNATPALTRVYNNNEANGSQGTLIWNTISNLIYGCNAIPCASNWVQVGTGAGANFSSPPPIGNVLPNTVAASNFNSTGTSTQNIINASCISTGGIIDALCAGTGATGDVKIQGIIANASACPIAIGCIIDLRNMISTNDLLWLTNPVAGHNRGIQLLLGERTYIACQPIIDGQTGYVWTGVDAPPNTTAAVRGGTVIKAGTAADGCPGNFPNGAGTVVTTWQHGPFAAGTYAALFNASGNPDSGSTPIATADSFGGQLQHLLLDCNNLTTCTHNFFSTTQEERAGLFDIAMTGANNGCGFWDRQYQIGPPSPGGSGPVHFETHYATCVPGSQATNNTFIPFAFEGNTTFIEFTGQSGCSPTADPTNTGTPTAYSVDNGSGTPTAPVLTNGGNCTTGPSACFLRSASGGSGNVCALTLTGGSPNHVATITFSTACTSCTYSNAQVPGGGPRFSNITVIGGFNGGTIQVNDVFAIEGDYNTHIYDIHTQNVHGAVYHHGLGSAPYYSGVVEGINATNGGDAGSTVLHCGVGSLDNLCSGIGLQRLISTGNVVTDDPNGIILGTGDTPSHAYIPIYPLPIPIYGKTGLINTQATTHIVQQTCGLSAGSCTIGLTNGAVYSSATSYSCSCTSTTVGGACSVTQTSGSSITVNGTGGGTASLSCIGF